MCVLSKGVVTVCCVLRAVGEGKAWLCCVARSEGVCVVGVLRERFMLRVS